MRARDEDDLLGAFAPLVVAIRWGTILVGLAYAATHDPGRGDIVGALVLAAHAAFRTVRPLRYYRERLASLLMVLFEVGLTLGVVVATGYWRSPYVLTLANAIIAAGFARGFGFAIRTAVTATLAVAIPYEVEAAGEFDLTLQWGGELLLVALVAGYARRLFGEAQERQSAALVRMRDLTAANALLHQLHHVAQRLPASLDLDEVLDATVEQVRTMVPADVVAVLLWDEASMTWRVGAASGGKLPRSYRHEDLPDAVVRASTTERGVLAERLDADGGGLSRRATAGAYAPLRARNQVVGVVAVECGPGGTLTPESLDLLDRLADQAALAVDNARWFARLRTVGADEERTRIARDLHDRVGQSLAYLAFELDRLEKRATGSELAAEIERLRQDVRRVVGEVRDTLFDLRTDVSEDVGLADTLEAYLDRVRERTGIAISTSLDRRLRPPLLVERELWRIAQEAITNAERHAAASRISVRWERADGAGVLEVSDDGDGMPPSVREGGYGIVGMRERANAVGATLDVASAPGEGTTVRCRLRMEDG